MSAQFLFLFLQQSWYHLSSRFPRAIYVMLPNTCTTYIVNILQQYFDLLYTIIPIAPRDLSTAAESPI